MLLRFYQRRSLQTSESCGYCKLVVALYTKQPRSHYLSRMISYSNWTEWSTIQEVIESKSDEREVRGRLEIRSTIIPWIVRHEVQSLISHNYNKFRN